MNYSGILVARIIHKKTNVARGTWFHSEPGLWLESRIAKESINLSYVDDSLIRAQFLFLRKFLDFQIEEYIIHEILSLKFLLPKIHF